MNSRKRVVVTGLGIVSPLGFGESELWSNVLAGHCGIKTLTAFDVSPYKVKHGAEVDRERLTQALQTLHMPRQDRAVEMAIVASADALAQAGYGEHEPPVTPKPIPVIFGTGVGLIDTLFDSCRNFEIKGLKGLRPTSIPRCMANAVSAQISMRFALTGTNYVITCACTSATTAIGTAFRNIRDGYAEQVLCGGTEAPFERCLFGAWNNLGVLSPLDPPETACRPFDASRAGCVLGEGSAALFLESLESAQKRGAKIRGELIGFGESSDATHITSPSVEGQSTAIRAALADAGIEPGNVGFINAHGTATRANDETEAASIRKTFGPWADSIPVASNKSLFGHLLGASGALESIITLLGLETGTVPPNLNLTSQDSTCAINLIGPKKAHVDAEIAIKNSFGFGGTNGVLVFRRWKD